MGLTNPASPHVTKLESPTSASSELATVDKENVAQILCDRFSGEIAQAAKKYHLSESYLSGVLKQGIAIMPDDELGNLLKGIDSGQVQEAKRFGGSSAERVGIGQVTVLSAAAVAERQGVSAHEYAGTHYSEIYKAQQDPAQSIETLAKVLKDNVSLYGEIAGKSLETKQLFASLKHLIGTEGRDVIGEAQYEAVKNNNAEAINSWEKVAAVLSQGKYQELVERTEVACGFHKLKDESKQLLSKLNLPQEK